MGVHCEIHLYKTTDGVFVPGTKISGAIKYAFDEETTIKKMIVSLKGSGYLRVRDKRNKKRDHTCVYRNNETYVDIDHVVHQDEKIFPIGLYEITFSFKIPPNLPPTLKYFKHIPFYNIRCVISYYIRIKFERPGIFKFNKRLRKDITLVSGITPRYPTIPTIYDEHTNLFHLFSWKTSALGMKANIKSCVIAPGGKIELDYKVVNDSRVIVKAVEFKLVETYTFKPNGHVVVKAHKDVINSDSKNSSVAMGETKKMHVVMNVPTDITSIENSDMVSRDYYVKMTVVVPMPHFNATLEIPVQIGGHEESDISLNNKYNPNPPAYNPNAPTDDQYNPSAPPYTPGDPADNQYIPSASSGNSYNDPPPSYWEVMGEQNEDDENDEDSD